MMYFLNRGGARYGPYSVEDVRRYLESGNIAPTDRMEPEDGGSPLTAAQLTGPLGTQPSPEMQAPPHTATPASEAHAGMGFQPAQPLGAPGYGPAYPMQAMASAIPPGAPPPPGMDWWLLLILTVVTCSLFGYIWAIVQSRWVKKLDPGSRATLYLLLPLLLIPLMVAIAIGGGVLGGVVGQHEEVIGGFMMVPILLFSIGAAIANIAAFVSMSNSLSAATAHWGAARIDLGGAFLAVVVVGWMTSLLFFIAPVWIQYRLDEVRRLQAWGGVRPQ